MQTQILALPASFVVGFLAGYFTRKNWFIFRRLFAGGRNNKDNEKSNLAKKKTDNEPQSSADKGKVEPSEAVK